MNYADSIPHSMRCGHTQAIMRPWFCYQCTQEDAESRYILMNNAYRAGEEMCTDKDFDRYERYCRERHPFSEIFHKVGVIMYWSIVYLDFEGRERIRMGSGDHSMTESLYWIRDELEGRLLFGYFDHYASRPDDTNYLV